MPWDQRFYARASSSHPPSPRPALSVVTTTCSTASSRAVRRIAAPHSWSLKHFSFRQESEHKWFLLNFCAPFTRYTLQHRSAWGFSTEDKSSASGQSYAYSWNNAPVVLEESWEGALLNWCRCGGRRRFGHLHQWQSDTSETKVSHLSHGHSDHDHTGRGICKHQWILASCDPEHCHFYTCAGLHRTKHTEVSSTVNIGTGQTTFTTTHTKPCDETLLFPARTRPWLL